MTVADAIDELPISTPADLLEIDAERLRLWLFARLAAEPRDRWNDESLAVARPLA